MTTTATAQFVSLPLAAVTESPTNPRRVFEVQPMAELVESVREQGVLQPILVRERKQLAAAGDGDLAEEPEPSYEIVAGARRFRAAREAGLLSVPCIVRQLTDKQTLEVQFIENLQREGLHPLDEGYGYKRLHDDHAYTVEALAAKLGKSMAYVYGRMQLAKLPVKAQTLFLEGKIDLSHAQLVTRIPVPELADKAAAAIAKGDSQGAPMSFRASAEFVRRNYQCNLKDAPFPTQDRDLVPDAGPCGRCPKRTGNQKDLFGDVADGLSADVCTDPQCFELKSKRHFDVRKAEVLAKGGRVVEGKKAQEVLFSGSLVEPDAMCPQDIENRTWKQLAKGQKVQTVLIQGRDGQAEVRWERADAAKAGIENGYAFLKPVKAPASKSSGGGLDEQKKWEEKRRIQNLVRERVVPLLVTAAVKADPATALRAIMLPECQYLSEAIRERRAMGARDTKGVAKFLAGLNLSQLIGLQAEIGWDDRNDATLCKDLGVDLKAIEKQVVAEEKAKAKAEAKAAKKPAAKASKKTGKKGKAKTAVAGPDVHAGGLKGRGGSPRTGD